MVVCWRRNQLAWSFFGAQGRSQRLGHYFWRLLSEDWSLWNLTPGWRDSNRFGRIHAIFVREIGKKVTESGSSRTPA